MKVKALLAIAAALALSACVVADDPYYDDYSRENSARDYDHYDHGPRYRDRDDRDYRDYRDDRRSRRNSRIDSKFNCENGLSVRFRRTLYRRQRLVRQRCGMASERRRGLLLVYRSVRQQSGHFLPGPLIISLWTLRPSEKEKHFAVCCGVLFVCLPFVR